MKEELVKYTCDMCKDDIIINKGAYGGSPLDKWVRMYVKLKPIDIQKTKLHFCCIYCAEQYLHSLNEDN